MNRGLLINVRLLVLSILVFVACFLRTPSVWAYTAVNDTVNVTTGAVSQLIDVASNDIVGAGAFSITNVAQVGPTNGSNLVIVSNPAGYPAGDYFEYTPPTTFVGTENFTYTIENDGDGTSAVPTLTLVVGGTNGAPTLDSSSGTVIEDNVTTVATFSDPDGDTLSASTLTLSDALAGSVAFNGTQIIFSPAADFYGTFSIDYAISDGSLSISDNDLPVQVFQVNDAPVPRQDNVGSILQGAVTTVDINDEGYVDDVDLDLSTIVTASIDSAVKGSVSFSGANLTYTPEPTFAGTAVITFTVIDDGASYNNATDLLSGTQDGVVTVTVGTGNSTPTLDSSVTAVAEDTDTIVATFSDANLGDTLSLVTATVNNDGGGSVSFDGSNLFYAPGDDFTGFVSIDYQIIDDDSVGSGTGLSITDTVEFTVTAVNDAPTPRQNVLADTDEGEEIAFDINDAGYFDDPENDSGTIISANIDSSVKGTVSFSGSDLVYTPTANFTGTAYIRFTLADDGTTDGASDPQNGTQPGIIRVTVNPENDAPEAGSVALTLDANDDGVYPVLDFSTDPEGDTLIINDIISVKENGVNVTIATSSHSDTEIFYTPSTNFSGTTIIIYEIEDQNDQAGGDGSNKLTDRGQITVTVSSGLVNDAPVVTAATATIFEDSETQTYDVILDNVFDEEGDSVTVTGIVFVSEDGIDVTSATTSFNTEQVLYTPSPNFNGTTTIIYSVSDNDASGDGTNTQSANGSIIVTVMPVSDPPEIVINATTASDAVTTAEENTPYKITIVTNSVDADGDQLSFILDDISTSATVTPDDDNGDGIWDGTVTYTPGQDYSGPEVFRYTVTDGVDSVSESITLNVLSTGNDAPVLADDTQTIMEDASGTQIDVLGNDYDPDINDELTIISAFGAVNGTLDWNRDSGKSLYYKPNANFNGSETITYRVTDGVGYRDAVLKIFVLPVDDAPVPTQLEDASDYIATVIANSELITITLYADGLDARDGDQLTLADGAITGDSGGVFVVDDVDGDGNWDGTVTYTPAEGFVGIETIIYSVTDASNNSTVATTSALVTTNNAPVVDSDGSTNVTENSIANTINLLSYIVDQEANLGVDTLTIESVTAQGTGSAAVTGDLSISYTPAADFYGSEVLEITVTDGVSTVTGYHTMIVMIDDQDAPVISTDFPRVYTAGLNQSTTINVIGALDINGQLYISDESPNLYLSITEPPNYGSASTDGTSIFYTPDSPVLTNLDDSITFEIFDGTNAVSTTILIDLVPSNAGGCSASAVSLDDPALTDGCSITPTGYRLEVALFGLCTSAPTRPTTSSEYDLSNCSYFFDGTASGESSTVSFGGINESTVFEGAIAAPEYNTYTHGILVVSNDLQMKGGLELQAGSVTPFCVTGPQYDGNIQCFASETEAQATFIDDDPINYLFEPGIHQFHFSEADVSAYLVKSTSEGSRYLVADDTSATAIVLIDKFDSPKTFTADTREIEILLGLSQSMILKGGSAKTAPFSIDFKVR